MSNQNIFTLDKLSLHDFDTDADLIPLMTPEDEEEMTNEELPNSIAILPLRNTVLFPGVVIPITAGRDKSIKLINDANAAGRTIGVVAQKDEDVEDPKRNDIHSIGTVAQILRVLKMPDGNVTVILQGKKRFEITKVISEEPYINALIKEVPEKRPGTTDTEFGAIIESIKEMAIKIIKESPNIPTEATFAIKNIESQSFLINFVSSNMNLSVKEKQDLLMMNVLKERALTTLRYMNTELQKLELRNDIQSKVRVDLDQQQ
ncbi:LON peptidase substrate-binding domain-containing protein, partial [Flavobacterium sp.]|uniref:LON peptidase substrate-binding domain-containing protein n=1 Tax=Flavobacterium sp. TaxID=239 RepID=UPI002FDAD7C3